jgi:hypothetical protein
VKKVPRPLKRRWALLISAFPTSFLVLIAYPILRTPPLEALVWAGIGAAFWHGYVLWRGYYDDHTQTADAK